MQSVRCRLTRTGGCFVKFYPVNPGRLPSWRALCTTSSLHQAAAANPGVPSNVTENQRVFGSLKLKSEVADSSKIPAVLPALKAKRTSSTNPADHTRDLEAFYYTVPPDEANKVFGTGPYRSRALDYLMDQFIVTDEAALMIREPALEIMEYIKKSNLAFPAIRYVLHGRRGSGKTSALAHLLHYFFANKWLIFHVPLVSKYSRPDLKINDAPSADSTFKRGRLDLPTDSANWLQHFLHQNSAILTDPASKLLTHQTYVWSKREETPAGSRLIDIVELGIKRARYANDCIGVVVKELKMLAGETGQKVAVVMDGVNALWTLTEIPQTNRRLGKAPPEIISLFCHFNSIIQNDWTNGAIVTSVDGVGIVGEITHKDDSDNHFPRYLLRGRGWEVMDPMVPVFVAPYKDKELTSCIDYHIETRWLQHEAARTDKGREELKFVCGMNPGDLRKLVSRL